MPHTRYLLTRDTNTEIGTTAIAVGEYDNRVLGWPRGGFVAAARKHD